MQEVDAYEGMTEPSGYAVSESDRMEASFTDVTVIQRGEVNFIAKGIRYGKWFSLKGINPRLRHDEGVMAMLRKEFDLLLGMEHPGVVSVNNLEEVEDLGPCIVMQYIDGPTLRQWLMGHPPLELRMDIAKQLLDTVAYIHSKGVVHRDIKPDNIMITRIGQRAVLIDFGLADTDDYAILKHPAGTPSYISAEQQTDCRPDIRNDIFSLGKVLMEVLPERRFARVFKDWNNRDSRPASTAILKQKLIRAHHTGKMMPWIIAGAMLLIGTATVLTISLHNSSSRQEDAPSSPETSKTATIESPKEEAPTTQEFPSSPPVPNPIASTESENIKQPLARPVESISSSPDEKEVKPQEGRKTRNESFKEMLRGGSILMEQEWKATALLYLDTVSNAAHIPKNWNMTRLIAIKNNYLQMLRMSIEGNTTNMRQYSLDVSDLEEMNKIYDNQIKDYQNKWSILRNKKISGH